MKNPAKTLLNELAAAPIKNGRQLLVRSFNVDEYAVLGQLQERGEVKLGNAWVNDGPNGRTFRVVVEAR